MLDGTRDRLYPVTDGASSRACVWPGCEGRAPLTLPLCMPHASEVAVRWNVEQVQPEQRERRLQEHIRLGEVATAQREAAKARSVVYYVRTDAGHIKIGFSTCLEMRLSSLRLHPTAVLVTEPGGRKVEAARHEQFAHARIDPRREDFSSMDVALLEHIQELQEIEREVREQAS